MYYKDNKVVSKLPESYDRYSHFALMCSRGDLDPLDFGFIPYTDSAPAYNPETHTITRGEVVVENNVASPQYTVTPIDVSIIKSSKLNAVAAKRYEEESKGVITPWGMAQTDKVSQSALTGAVVAVQAGLRQDGAVWKFVEGTAPLTNAEVMQLAGIVLTHVQTAFEREAELRAMIEADPTVAWEW